MSKFAWVTLTTNDTYSLGALVLANSLKRAGTAHQLAVLVTPGVSEAMRNKLKDVYNVVEDVNVMDSNDAANLALLSRPELGITFTKLHCWRLVQFEKCVFLDADTLVIQNCDELFEREELSAAPDVSWPDCFNSGVFVFSPSLDTFAKITEFAITHGSFDGGDQGLLNSYFADWAYTDIKKHLPFLYNVTAYASYCYLPAFKQFRDKIKILHFAGKLKPWLIQFNSESKTACTPSDYGHAADLIQLWWNIFCESVHQNLSNTMHQYHEQYNIRFANSQLQYIQNQSHYQHPQPQQQQQPQPQQHECHEQDPVLQHFLFDLDNVCEYHDPWVDYYENLEKDFIENECESMSVHIAVNNDEPCVLEESTGNAIENVLCLDQQERVLNVNDIIDNIETSNNNIYYEQNSGLSLEKCVKEEAINADKCTDIEASENHCLHTVEKKHTDEVTRHSVSEEFPSANLLLPENEDSEHAFQKDYPPSGIDSAIRMQATVANEAGLAGALSQLRLGAQRTPEQEAYEELMRRQCWESGQIDYTGKDSFENIWKKISQTLEQKPAQAAPPKEDDKSELLTSADIEDGKVEYDPATKSSTKYHLLDGGYEMIITTPQPNGTIKTQVKTFWDPKPVSEEDLANEAKNKKLIKSRLGKEIRIDKKTTMLTREIEGGYEEVYTTVNDDGTKSMRTKTFFDSVPQEDLPNLGQSPRNKPANKKALTKISSVDSTDSTETRKVVQTVQQQKNAMQNVQQKGSKFSEQSTLEESRRVTQNIEITENNRTVRKNSVQEQNVKAISSNTTDGKTKKKKKSAIPPPPPDFIENDTTTVSSKRVPGGVQYTYSTQLESGKTITTTKTVYEEEYVELTEEELREYQKTLKDAQKHKNVTSTKKLRSESGTKKIVPSENPGDVTTVETIKIQGGTEYHYTTVTKEGIVKKAVKTIYDPVPSKKNPDDTDEEEIIEDYEEEIIEPGEKNIKTIETIQKMPQRFEEEITITHEKKEKKVKKSMMISN